MDQRDRLQSLTDDDLLAGLSSIVHARNQITAEFLAYLAELDRRQLFLDLGYPSLFDYCVRALGLCESTAGRHIAAARVCRDHAQALAMVARGELHASGLSLMRKHVTAENAAELFEACVHKSAREVEVVLAARFPKPDVADLIRRLPTPNVESGASTARPEPLSADRFGVHFTADSEFCELLERVRGLAGHRLPSGDLLTLMKRGLAAYERELEKERFSIGRKPKPARSIGKARFESAPRSVAGASEDHLEERLAEPPTLRAAEMGSQPRSPGAKRVRRRSAAVAREVLLRDGKQCSFVSADGRRCSSRRCLELDHVKPWARGGADNSENLRVRCRAHNQRYAKQCFGELHVRAARARKLRGQAGAPGSDGAMSRGARAPDGALGGAR